MGRKYPKSYTNVAKEIVTSWSGIGGNYVLVAPPLTDPEYVFKKLNDVSFYEQCDLDPEKFAVAYLRQVSYQTSEEFVRRVMKMWDVNVDADDVEYQNDALDILQDAIEILEEQGRTPVILLPQFHKAIEKLTWSLGARLREMEINYGLCTVVELPVPLSRLRGRWEMNPEKETFICSDFGQGHSMILLSGYQRDEVQTLVEQSDIPQKYLQDYLEKIQLWSGGIPALVSWLIRVAQRSKSIEDFEIVARKGSVEQCRRFLNWLDAPGEDYYKRRISSIWQEVASDEERTEVRDHDWKDVLIDRDGHVCSAAIGFACSNIIGGNCKQSLAYISNAVTEGIIAKVDALVNGLSEACRTEESLKYILVTIPVWRLAYGFSPDWVSIEKASKRAENQLDRDENISAKNLASALKSWHNFAKGINDFNRLVDNNKEKGWRLTDSLSGRGKGKDSPLAAIQLVLYRLYEADKIKDSNAALKSVLEIPEQILQIYCGRKLQIPVWEAPEFEDDVIEAVRELWEAGKYRVPNKGSRLGFSDLLYIGWVLMSRLDQKDRLFQEFSDINYWKLTYDEIRNQPAHSITFESKKQWQDFYSRCLALTDQLAKTLTGKTSDEALPKLDVIIASLAKQDRQTHK